MSDSDHHEPSSEDRLILDLLASGGEEALESGPDRDAQEIARERRAFLEVLGLLSYGIEPVAPSPAIRERILEAVGETTAAARAGDDSGITPSGSAVSGSFNWLLPLAASVVFVMMVATGWLVLQVRGQQTQIAELSSQLDRARSTEAELATSRGMLSEMRSRLELVTAPGSEFCALRPPEGSSAAKAVGMVVMHPVKDEWFLRIEGLEPCSQGRKYVLWFATEDGTQPGPIFGVKQPGDSIELTVSGRPSKIDAIMITLEADPMPEAPSMEPLLFGDERMQLL
ncbi:MAG: anti-sigma factor [Thermoanaerobaculia bacterium]